MRRREEEEKGRKMLENSEFGTLTRLAIPVVFTYTLQMSLTLVMLFCVGHKGTAIDLGAAALGNLYCSVTGLTVGMGMATAMDTLCSQAYGQDPKSPLVGIIFQRAMAIMTCLSLPITFLWWNAEPILLACGQHPEITALTKIFCRWMIPGLLPFLVFECFKKYLQSQGMMLETMWALGCASLLNLLVHYVLLYHWDWGFEAAPISLSLTYISLPLFLLLFVRLTQAHRSTWPGWSQKALSDWLPFLRLGIPSLLMLCAEWWASEIIVLAAGFIGDNDLAAQTIVTTTNSIVFMVPFGISVAINTRVGNLLGAGSPDKAKKSAVLAVGLNLAFGLGSFLVLIGFRNVWGYIFSEDQEVAHLVSVVLAIYAVAQLFDGCQGVEAGILRGLGKQNLGSILNFVAYYVMGIPLGLSLAFNNHMGISGLWWGMCFSFICCTCFFTYVLFQVDWKKESLLAKDRIKQELEKLGLEKDHSFGGFYH